MFVHIVNRAPERRQSASLVRDRTDSDPLAGPKGVPTPLNTSTASVGSSSGLALGPPPTPTVPVGDLSQSVPPQLTTVAPGGAGAPLHISHPTHIRIGATGGTHASIDVSSLTATQMQRSEGAGTSSYWNYLRFLFVSISKMVCCDTILFPDLYEKGG